MAKVKFINDLPEWFKLKNYDVIRDLSIEEIKEQLACRGLILSSLKWLDNSVFDLSGVSVFWQGLDPCIENWVNIMKGNVVLQNCLHSAQDGDENRLAHTDAIRGFTSVDAIYHTKNLVNNNFIDFENVGNLHVITPNTSTFTDYDLDKKNSFNIRDKHVTINLDLVNYSDEELLKHLKELLPKWRRELNVPEAKKRTGKSDDFFSKVKQYRIIPLLDLRIWEKVSNMKIEQDILRLALYPDRPMTKDDFKPVINTEKQILNDTYRHNAPIFPEKVTKK